MIENQTVETQFHNASLDRPQYIVPTLETYGEDFLKENFAEVFASPAFSDHWPAPPDE